jgi:hypothetical protein
MYRNITIDKPDIKIYLQIIISLGFSGERLETINPRLVLSLKSAVPSQFWPLGYQQ